ncbi:uncharacterized protein LOC132552408 [Ylistrum balloti]|uniref:uncharacterized protein LOC132552388 n=1 Tax=Ylistrum balloti TaxID=509963 RepID=UPI002905D4E6|nr:uncharacterized protein LOC132552388 [Ylistrum balloti]XP_060072553.1 uncharacterized protein LOC132552398 [Ylistrum balloti]XP_060072562.1 uncharacterized protein LOC132552408 [Ylistrum balloti]
MNGILGLLACMVALTCAMTTTKAPHNHNNHNTTHQHGHHGTHAPHIGEGFAFKYDINSQRMAIVSNHQCWIYNPSDDEKSHIQDIHVLRNLEVKLIQLIDSNPSSTPMTHDDLALMSSSLAHTCHPGWPIYVLN